MGNEGNGISKEVAKLEREIAENKAGAVSYEEYIRRKNKTTT